MPRFFRRFAEGVFDLEDVARRTHALADFIIAAGAKYGFAPGQLTALGYSNGANIAASLLLLRPEVLARAVLLRPMVVLQPDLPPDLSGKEICVLSGQHDPIVPVDQPEQLAEQFRQARAHVDLHWLEAGHQLTGPDFAQASIFLGSKP
jgi:predicted esterase